MSVTGRLCFALFCVLLALLSGCFMKAGNCVCRETGYDRLFRNHAGWIGGDAAGSVLLDHGRVLWLFGDSLLGKISQGHRHIDAMVHNTIAIQSGSTPQNSRMEFFHGGNALMPQAFIRPKSLKEWLWLSGGAIRNINGLYLFMPRITNASGPKGWNFRVQGMVLGRVRNPEEPPNFWKIHQFGMPWFRGEESGKERSFGASILQAGPWVYIYGFECEKSTGNRCLLIARTRDASLENFGAWEFLANGAWVRDFKKASPQADHLGTEFSVSWLPGLHRYVLVYTKDGLSDKIIMRSSPSPSGPWSDPITIFKIPNFSHSRGTFCYAAKAHPELARGDDKMVISYICNNSNLHRLIKDPGTYVPRFIEVQLHCASTSAHPPPNLEKSKSKASLIH
jgi:hypothetical protein